MKQTLFYIPEELFGLPVFGFGLALTMLVIGIAFAVGRRFAKTKKFDEEIGSYFGLLAIGSTILVFVAPYLSEPKLGLPIRGFGFFLTIAILSALALALRLAKQRGISPDTMFSLCLWSVVSGLLGARLFYVTEYWQEMIVFDLAGNLLFRESFFSVVNIAKGGIVVYGSIIGGMVGAIIFMLRNRLPILPTLDIMAPALMLGIAIGRIGCLMNGCCFGSVCDLPWAITFPTDSPAHVHQVAHGETFYYGLKFEDRDVAVAVQEVQPNSGAEQAGLKPGMVLKGISGMVDGRPQGWFVRKTIGAFEVIHDLNRADPQGNLRFDVYDGAVEKSFFVGPSPSVVLPIHPTQIYSSLGAACICGTLLFLQGFAFFQQRNGSVFVAFLFLYSTGRFFIETLRTDEGSFLGTGLTVSQNVCILVFLAAVVLGVLCRGSVRQQDK